MWQFSQVIDGLTEACTALNTPITGGNVSFYNETLGKSIYPTPVIGVLGVIEGVSRVLKIAFREEGNIILLLDGSNSIEGGLSASPVPDAGREFSSSEYSKTIAGIVAGEPPAINLPAEKRLIDCLVALAVLDALQSAHDISDGGLAVTLAESCLAGDRFGAQAELGEPGSAEAALFGERGARAVVSVAPSKLAAVLDTARQYSVAAYHIGQVIRGDAFRIQYKGSTVIDTSVEAIRKIWAYSLEHSLGLR
jgi:phosphoribosylformylglycinamidine synthase